ncbi:MAG TPA: MarR family transcriptional regulator [Catenuloplanes sp.]
MGENRWLTDEQQWAWRRLAALVTLLPATLDTQLQRDAQLSHFGYWVLAMLSETPGRALRMSELAALSNSSQSRLSHMTTRLEERGWIRRERATQDRRGSLAVLTDAGYAKVVASAPAHVEHVRSLVFDTLSPEQARQLGEMCELLLRVVDPDGTAAAVEQRGGGHQGAGDPSADPPTTGPAR